MTEAADNTPGKRPPDPVSGDDIVEKRLSTNQLAVMRSLFVAALLLIVVGAAFVLGGMLGGVWVSVVGIVLLVCTLVAWSALTPKGAATRSKPGSTGKQLALIIGAVFIAVMAIALIDVFFA
ncbi:hypothetical protein ACWIGW_40030 [Nocardia brasiliensis]